MRKPIIVGNWKMNKTMKETKEFMEAVDAAAASENAVFGIGAPYTALSAAVAGAKNLVIAAENCTGRTVEPSLVKFLYLCCRRLVLHTVSSDILSVVKCSMTQTKL